MYKTIARANASFSNRVYDVFCCATYTNIQIFRHTRFYGGKVKYDYIFGRNFQKSLVELPINKYQGLTVIACTLNVKVIETKTNTLQ